MMICHNVEELDVSQPWPDERDLSPQCKGHFFKVPSYTLFGHFRNSGPICNIFAVLETR